LVDLYRSVRRIAAAAPANVPELQGGRGCGLQAERARLQIALGWIRVDERGNRRQRRAVGLELRHAVGAVDEPPERVDGVRTRGAAWDRHGRTRIGKADAGGGEIVVGAEHLVRALTGLPDRRLLLRLRGGDRRRGGGVGTGAGTEL